MNITVSRTSAAQRRADPGPSAKVAAKQLNIVRRCRESCAGSRLCARSFETRFALVRARLAGT
jgi:hypothetical protein